MELTQNELKEMLAYPDMRPYDFDISLSAWFYRISFWGSIGIKYTDLENSIKNISVTQQKFLDVVGDEEDNKIFGLWQINQLEVNKLVFYRNYLAYDGKKYKKEFVVEVKLKGNFQKEMDKIKNKGIFGWLFKS